VKQRGIEGLREAHPLCGKITNQAYEENRVMKSKLILLTIIFLSLISSCSPNRQESTLVAQATSSIKPTPVPESTSTPDIPDPEHISIDTEWGNYSNFRLGFSMNIPKSMYRFDAGCYWNEDSGDYSYRPEGGKVPVVVIEGEDRIYITSKYDVVLTNKTQVPSGAGFISKFAGCERVENDLETVKSRDYSSGIWEIAFRITETDQDLEILVDEYYGECFSVGDIIPVDGKEYSIVKVVGDQKPIEVSECLLRGMYIFLYSQEFNIAATWKIGQSTHFNAYGGEGVVDFGAYDGDMGASFKFIARGQNQ